MLNDLFKEEEKDLKEESKNIETNIHPAKMGEKLNIKWFRKNTKKSRKK